MAVTVDKIKSRLRTKYPKANLSTKRLDEISAKLAKKPVDDATDEQIDEVLEDYNDNGAMTFEEIAKSDDKIRTLEAKQPKVEVKPDDIKQDDPDEPAWFKSYRETQDKKFADLQASQTINTRKEALLSKFKGVDKSIIEDLSSDFETMTFPDDEAFNNFVERKTTRFKAEIEKAKLDGFDGSDNPGGGNGEKPNNFSKVKEKTAEETKDLANEI